jgi:hypothetical protein
LFRPSLSEDVTRENAAIFDIKKAKFSAKADCRCELVRVIAPHHQVGDDRPRFADAR